MKLSLLADTYAVARLAPNERVPDWAAGDFVSVTRTKDELSVVCLKKYVPQNARAERGWRAFKLEGPIPFEQTGVLSSIAKPLADATIPVFAISTYDTDYMLVKSRDVERASAALTNAGFSVTA